MLGLVFLVVAVTVAAAASLAGCASPKPYPPTDDHPRESTAPITGDDGPPPPPDDVRPCPPDAPDPATRFEALAAVLPTGFSPVTHEGRPLLVATVPGGVLGLIHDGDSTRVVSVACAGITPEAGPWIGEIGTDCRVTAFRPRLLTGEEPPPARAPESLYDGFQTSLACGRREVSVFVFARDRLIEEEQPRSGATEKRDEPYILITPLSTVARTVLRDLSGDGTLDLLRYSRLFQHDGRWELLLEAYRWNGSDFVLTAETALLREVNRRLDRLERLLGEPVRPEEEETIDRALSPTGDAPAATSLIPYAQVRIPRITNLPLQPDIEHWRFEYEIALDAEVYRIMIWIDANPLLAEPVGIEGMDYRTDGLP